MKQKSLFVFLLFFSYTVFAQDIIYLRNGEKIKAKVKEVTIWAVIYKKQSNPDGPDYKEYKKNIELVSYANGEEEWYDRNEGVHNSASSDNIFWKKRKGGFIGAWGGLAAGFINRLDAPALPKLSFQSGFLYKNNLTNHFGFITGVSLSNIHCTLYSSYKENIFSPGIRDEVNGYMTYFSIPLLVSITTGKPGKLNINPEAGLMMGGMLSHYYKHSAITETTQGKKDLTIDFYISVNLSYPLSERFTLAIGPYILANTSNLYTSVGGNFKLWYKFKYHNE